MGQIWLKKIIRYNKGIRKNVVHLSGRNYGSRLDIEIKIDKKNFKIFQVIDNYG